MKKERSSGAVVFRIEGNKILYLLLFGPSYWGFVKGLIEKGENEKETAVREAKEEAGIKIKILEGFQAKIKYMYKFDGVLIDKEATFFVAESDKKNIKISHEHKDYRWAEFDEAQKIMKFKNQKEVLIDANEFILNWMKQKGQGKLF